MRQGATVTSFAETPQCIARLALGSGGKPHGRQQRSPRVVADKCPPARDIPPVGRDSRRAREAIEQRGIGGRAGARSSGRSTSRSTLRAATASAGLTTADLVRASLFDPTAPPERCPGGGARSVSRAAGLRSRAPSGNPMPSPGTAPSALSAITCQRCPARTGGNVTSMSAAPRCETSARRSVV